MKVAISIQDNIFKEIEATARALHCSISEIFSMAARDFLDKIKSRNILDALNAAHAEAEPPDEARLRKASKKRYRRAALKERY